MEYVTVAQEGTAEFVERKSRFIGSCRPVATEEEALAFIAGLKSRYWDASHNVYAYILREGGIQRFSDDGEPQGTAGIPVIDTMKKAGVTDAVVVATRYFGGILLGGGGLIRAYAHTASIALEAACKVRMKECLLMEVACGYENYGRVQALVPECGGVVEDTAFLEQVSLRFRLEPERREDLCRRLADATAGRALLSEAGKSFFPFALEE
ncbi:IMPACT family protein [Acutalibacter caecimuris]|uniref:IMPACT family protein n=1 Tax=Acutalibacter caecimuris TaxID=3093657 RepID=UPI002AC98438|nr:YigZ family protein [Acutalibacter sp. M00118]